MTLNSRTIAALLIVAAVGAGAAAWTWMGPAKLLSEDAAVIARGAAIYADHCAACHGEQLEGQPDWRSRKPDGRLPAPPHDQTGHTWHHPDEVLFRIVKRGPAAAVAGDYESDMPGFAGVLNDEEIRAVLAFIKSTWPQDIKTRQRLISERTAKAAP
ncbi:c-type cytochrome [Indioceanicola profundi]|uniref:c-type cytochrome n=1 Tax=Indioceanicola profundi TaxID=2220096 RepID=UPI000E6ADE37|nr:cytochrome c [Indioceanicola profundi]